MKPIFSKTTERLLLVAKLSDDKMKLFLDVEPIIKEEPPAPAPAESKASAPQVADGGAQGEVAASPPPASPPPALAPQAEPAPPPQPITRDDILTLLKEIVSPDMLNIGVIDDIVMRLNKGEKVEERRVAKGEEAQTGTDGKILYMVKRFTGNVEVQVDEKGVADLRVLHLFDNITQGTTVARVYPPKNGVDGKDALGKVIPSKPGKPYKVSLDRTLALKDSGQQSDSFQIVVAETDGYLSEESGKLTIKPELVVAGDLDFHMGTIDFIGIVRVKGDVLPGFSVRAKRGIVIAGSAREASLICPEGDIVVKGYVYGGESAKVVCGKNFACAVAQELDAEVVGNIVIDKEATDCTLRTQSAISMSKGTLMGGRAWAVCGVEAKQLGNEAGQETHIRVCSDVEMTTEYGVLVANIENHEKALKMIDLHLGPFAVNPGRIEVLQGPHRAKMEKLLTKKREIMLSHQNLLKKKEEMLASARTNPIVRVNFLSKLYDGVVVSVAKEEFSTKEPLDGPASLDFISAENAFKVGELKPLECSTTHSSSPEGGT